MADKAQNKKSGLVRLVNTARLGLACAPSFKPGVAFIAIFALSPHLHLSP